MSTAMKNAYLEQVVAQKAQLENDLRRRAAPEPMLSSGDDTDRAFPGSGAVPIRITGWWRWKNVIVPPNAYVVHTRRGHAEPLDCGLGVSFRFDPLRDAFLVVPSAMQTILLNANCICRERQGILVQGYVQWMIDDFKTAYRKLDFSDSEDPMRLVNVQIREQAEATIKDTVATMSIDDVLSDKQPIIKELTARLRKILEGEGGDKGLGLRIVTIQIKEAVVSSPTVWETLQRPFRAERSKEARLAELQHEAVVRQREAEERARAEALEAQQQAAAFDRSQNEMVRRAKLEADAIAIERQTIERQGELARLRAEQEILERGVRQEAENRQTLREIEFEAARRKIDNDLSETALKMRLIDAMPEIAEKMPKAEHLRAISLNGQDGLASLLGGIFKAVKSA